MGFNEEMMNTDGKLNMAPKKGKKEPKPEPRVLAGSKDYDYYDLGSSKPLKGGNSW